MNFEWAETALVYSVLWVVAVSAGIFLASRISKWRKW